MDERIVQFRVGVMVLATLLITIILVVLFGKSPTIFKKTYTIQIAFADAPGVSRDTPVKKSGVLIGRVASVDLQDEGGVIVTARIDGDKILRHNEVARINTSLLGDSVIHFVNSGKKSLSSSVVEDGSKLQGVAYDDPIQVISNLQERLSGAIGSVTNTSNELGQVVHQVGDILRGNEQKINRIVAQADETSSLLKQTVTNANDIFGSTETKTKIQDTLAQMPELMRETRDTVRQMNSTMTLVDKNLQNLDRFTTTLGDQGEGVVSQLGSSAQKLDALLGELVKFTRALNSSEGTLGQLINDPQLYNNLNRAATNVEELSRQLRPIVNDVRVFTDQIARHPEKLGVRGAIERSEGTKWNARQ